MMAVRPQEADEEVEVFTFPLETYARWHLHRCKYRSGVAMDRKAAEMAV